MFENILEKKNERKKNEIFDFAETSKNRVFGFLIYPSRTRDSLKPDFEVWSARTPTPGNERQSTTSAVVGRFAMGQWGSGGGA